MIQPWRHSIPLLIGGLNSFQIYICGLIYDGVAKKLTRWEHHRTNTEYEDSLLLKTFAFQFINNFGSYIYMGFIQEFSSFAVLFGGPNGCSKGCVHYLGDQLFYVFMFKLIFGNILELSSGKTTNLFYRCCCGRKQAPDPLKKPKCSFQEFNCVCCWKKLFARCCCCWSKEQGQNKTKCNLFCCCTKHPYQNVGEKNPTNPNLDGQNDWMVKGPENKIHVERDFCEQQMYTSEERTKDYMELAILFGYTSLFVITSPQIVPFAFISVIFESQVDAEKLKSNFLRPMPQKAQDIGMVHDIFSKYRPLLGYM